jgi:hypothetical protein
VTFRGGSEAEQSANAMIAAVRQIGLRVSDDLHAWLEALAEREHRSLNGQIVWMLERAREQIEREHPPERDDR